MDQKSWKNFLIVSSDLFSDVLDIRVKRGAELSFRLKLHPSEMMEVMKDREVWRLNLELLHPQPSRKSGQ